MSYLKSLSTGENTYDVFNPDDLPIPEDAPSDDKMYGRKNGEWSEIKEVEWGNIVGDIEDQKDLQKALNDKLDADTTTITGDILSFEAENDHTIKDLKIAIEAVQDLHGYDNPWPAGGGKNKLKNNAISQTINEVVFTVNSDGTVKVNGTATTDHARLTISDSLGLEVGTSYILSGCPSGGSALTYMLRLYDSNNTAVGTDFGSGLTFTYAEGYSVKIITYKNVNISNLLFKPMVRLATVSDATFAPYENICPISGHTNAVVTRTGVNLWDGNVTTGRINTSTGETNSITPGKRTTSYISVLPSTKYYIHSGGDIHVYVIEYDANKDFVRYAGYYKNAVYTTGSSARYIMFYTVSDTDYDKIAFNYPYTATGYEAPHIQTVTIALGSTVYGGTLDVLTGTMRVTKGFLTLDGSDDETWTRWAGAGGTYQYDITDMIVSGHDRTAKTNWLKTEAVSEMGLGVRFGANNYRMYCYSIETKIQGVSISSVTDWRAYLAEHPLQVLYTLAEPFTVQLTPNDISTLIGTNNLWADTGESTAELYLTAGDLAYLDELDYNSEKLTNKPDFASMLAGTESSMKATKNYSSGDLIAVGDDLLKATSNIANGATLIIGANVFATTIDAELRLKANASEVTSALALKANSADITASLALKADKADTYTKAETEYVASQSNEAIVKHIGQTAIASFDDGANNIPVKDLKIAIEPVQDLHGYDAPWPAGGGANLLDPSKTSAATSLSSLGLTASYNNELVTISGTPNTTRETAYFNILNYSDFSLSGLDYYVQAFNVTGGTLKSIYGFRTESEKAVAIGIAIIENVAVNMSLRVSVSATSQTDWTPYSNICPISGHTSTVVTRTGKNLFSYQTIPQYAYAWYSGSTALADAAQPIYVKGGHKYIISATQSENVADTVLIRAWRKDGSILENEVSTLNMSDKYYSYASSYLSVPKYYTIQNIGTIVHIPFVTYIEPTEDLWLDIRMKANGGIGNNPIVTPFEDEAYTAYQGTSVTIQLGQTVYGGTFDVLTGTLTITHKSVTLNSSTSTNDYSYTPTTSITGAINPRITYAPYSSEGKQSGVVLSDMLSTDNRDTGAPLPWKIGGSSTAPRLFFGVPETITSKADFTTWLSTNSIQLVYPLATPVVITGLTPAQLDTLLGQNNIFANTGAVSVEYRADTKLYIDQKIAEATRKTRNFIAGEESEMKATKNYTTGEYLWVGDDLYKVTANIANGGTITVNSNVSKCTVGEQLKLALS